MTDEEFNRYCAEVLECVVHEYDEFTQTIYVHRGDGVIGKRYTDLNQMAEVFDKLWMENYRPYTFAELVTGKGIDQAMREFIESTRESE